MSKKVFSGEESRIFWNTISRCNDEDFDILYKYGAKSQEIEQQRDDLLTACEFAKAQIKKGSQKKALPILRAAIASTKA